MVWEIHVNREYISPAMERWLLDYYGKSCTQPDYKPAALSVSDTDDPDNEEISSMSRNFKLGCCIPDEKIVVPEKTGIKCDEEWENLSDIRHRISCVKIAQSKSIDSCQWKERLCTEEKDEIQSEKRKSTVEAVKGNEKVTSKDEGQQIIGKKSASKKNSGEKFPQETLSVVTDKDGDQKKACKRRKKKSREYFPQQLELTQDEVMEKVTKKNKGQKTIGKCSFSKKNSGKKFPQEKPALTWDKGKFMVFRVIFAVYWFANDIKLKLEGFTWMFLKEVLNYASSILSFTKRSRNKGCWMVCLILLLCISFGNIRAMALKGKVHVYVSLEDSNSMRIDVKPDKNAMGTSKWTTINTDGKIKVVAFNGRVKPQFKKKVYLENETSIRISNLSFMEWNRMWIYQKGTDFPIGTKQLSKYVDPVCANNLTVGNSTNSSVTVMWDSGLDRGHHMITILQSRVEGSSDWMSAFNTTEHTNQEVNFSISDLKQGTSYDIRLLTLDGNGSSSICKSHLITVKTKPAKPGNGGNGITYNILLIWLCCLLTCQSWIMH